MRGKAVGEHCSEMLTFEQTPDWREGASPADVWEKKFLADMKTNAKTLEVGMHTACLGNTKKPESSGWWEILVEKQV